MMPLVRSGIGFCVSGVSPGVRGAEVGVTGFGVGVWYGGSQPHMGLFACLFVSSSWSDGRIGRKDSIGGDVVKCIDYVWKVW